MDDPKNCNSRELSLILLGVCIGCKDTPIRKAVFSELDTNSFEQDVRKFLNAIRDSDIEAARQCSEKLGWSPINKDFAKGLVRGIAQSQRMRRIRTLLKETIPRLCQVNGDNPDEALRQAREMLEQMT